MAYNEQVLLPKVYDELLRLDSKLADEVAHALAGIDPARGHSPLIHLDEVGPEVPPESVAAPVSIPVAEAQAAATEVGPRASWRQVVQQAETTAEAKSETSHSPRMRPHGPAHRGPA